MNTPPTNLSQHHRFPAAIISYCVWLYCRFCLSDRGVIRTYEAVRYWCRTFGQASAHQLRRRRSRPGDKWPVDEVFLPIHGERHALWRAVDQAGGTCRRRSDSSASSGRA